MTLISETRTLLRTSEGIPVVVGDGKYPQDPPRPASDFEVELWEALREARLALHQLCQERGSSDGYAQTFALINKALGA